MQLDFNQARQNAERFRGNDLIDALYIPSQAQLTAASTTLSALMAANYVQLFKYGVGADNNGFTGTNGFANGKPKAFCSDITDGKLEGKRAMVMSMAVTWHPADPTAIDERALSDLELLTRSIGLEFNYDDRGVHEFGPVGAYPGNGWGIGRVSALASSISNPRTLVQTGAVDAKPRLLAVPLVLDYGNFKVAAPLLDTNISGPQFGWIMALRMGAVQQLEN